MEAMQTWAMMFDILAHDAPSQGVLSQHPRPHPLEKSTEPLESPRRYMVATEITRDVIEVLVQPALEVRRRFDRLRHPRSPDWRHGGDPALSERASRKEFHSAPLRFQRRTGAGLRRICS
jgi:hypothetical protein